MKNSESASSGVGFGGLLCVAFVVLKLCGVIDWSWWWVISPIWIPIAIVVAGFAIWIATQIPSAYRKVKTKRAVQKIMKEKGYNYHIALIEYNKSKNTITAKSKIKNNRYA